MADIEKFLGSADFGKGKLIGDDPSILALFQKERLYVSAHRHACARPDMVIEHYGREWLKTQPNPDLISGNEIERHGIETTRMRYDSCDYAYGSIICQEARVKPKLFRLLTTPVKRLSNEPVGVYENGRVPESYKSEMSPLSTPWGYALPREYIIGAGKGENRTWESEKRTLYLLQRSIERSDNPVDLLAYFSEAVAKFGGNPTEILSHVFEPEILREQNCYTLFRKIADSLRKNAPRLWKCYQSISPKQRKQSGILDFQY